MFHSRNKNTDPTRPVSAVQERGSKRKRQRRESSLTARPTRHAIHHTESHVHTQPAREEQSPAPAEDMPQPFSAKTVVSAVAVFAAFVVVGAWILANPPAIPEPSDGADGDEGPGFAEEDAGAWHKTVDGEKLVATRLDGTSYSSCDEIETINSLTELGCEAAVEARYNAKNGDILLDLTVMRMSDSDEAENAALRMGANDFVLESKESNTGNNHRRWGFVSSDEFVIAVRTEARPQASAELSDQYHEHFIADKAEEAAR